jgi:serine/threonine protein phosphatase PrpC
MRLLHAARSDVGLVRRQNEDSFVAVPGMYAVCDGMGGARAGEVASQAACSILADLPPAVGPDVLLEAIDEANRAIRDRSLGDPDLSGMGTTLTVASGTGPALSIAQVGDSRAYLLHEGRLRQVTQDHSLVAEMIRRGQLTAEQAAVHPHRSIITRALGTEDSVSPDVFELMLDPGDKVLLCSDGLSGMVPEEEIESLLSEAHMPEIAAEGLVAAALDHGGEDNVTVVVVFAVDDASAAAEAGGTGAGATLAGSDEGVASEAGADAVDTAGAGRDAHKKRSSSRKKLVLVIAAIVIVIGLGFGAFYGFNSTVYFVGTTQGEVALFQGMPYKVMGVRLYRSVEDSSIRFEDLDPYLQGRVDSHELVTKEEGLRFIRGLQTSQ